MRLAIAFLCFLLTLGPAAAETGAHDSASPCSGGDPHACLGLAFEAMGGEAALRAIASERLDVMSNTALMEQSYRQSPFITSYERDQVTIDFTHGRLVDAQHNVWPEADLNQAEYDATLVVTPDGAATKIGKDWSPGSGSDLDSAAQTLALGPERILMTAAHAADLHFEPDETLRSAPHTVLAFTWQTIPVRVLLGQATHLPDAVETVQQFRDYWYVWGDVKQTVYFDNFKVAGDIIYPTNEVTERNGAILSSSQVLDVKINPPLDEAAFASDPKSAQQSLASKGWSKAFTGAKPIALAPDVTLYPGSWNTTVIAQDDGIVILESPISETYMAGVFAAARSAYPGKKIKAVLTTSDSWPHVGGVRYDVAEKLPTYILDSNLPLLGRIVQSAHTIQPDSLEKSPATPNFVIVSQKREIGTGANRMVLYPLRGALTDRQYMVYFPEHRILYASDTLVILPDGSLYEPEFAREIRRAVEREHLSVDTVYAMHQTPVPWTKVTGMLDAVKAPA